jgi:hypothetical protein
LSKVFLQVKGPA